MTHYQLTLANQLAELQAWMDTIKGLLDLYHVEPGHGKRKGQWRVIHTESLTTVTHAATKPAALAKAREMTVALIKESQQ